jgi:hypothetical protein
MLYGEGAARDSVCRTRSVLTCTPCRLRDQLTGSLDLVTSERAPAHYTHSDCGAVGRSVRSVLSLPAMTLLSDRPACNSRVEFFGMYVSCILRVFFTLLCGVFVFFPGRSPARRERRQAQGHTHPDDGQDRQTQTDRRAETQETPQTTDRHETARGRGGTFVAPECRSRSRVERGGPSICDTTVY